MVRAEEEFEVRKMSSGKLRQMIIYTRLVVETKQHTYFQDFYNVSKWPQAGQSQAISFKDTPTQPTNYVQALYQVDCPRRVNLKPFRPKQKKQQIFF